MKGLILKDFYTFKRVQAMYCAIAMVLFLYCFITKKTIFFPITLILTFSTGITSTFTIDKKVKWEELLIVGPVSKKDIVTSKYVFSVIIIMASALLGLLLSIPNILSGAIKVLPLIELTILSMDIALCSNGGLIACMYVFKNIFEKMEILTLFSYPLAVFIVFALFKILDYVNQALGLSRFKIMLILTLLIILLLIFLLTIAVKIYEGRDVH